ncbi:ribonuclease H-like domain-containing protein [Patescibacteria group bacterium]|nr:ribonuclease H-like domain-containing protein [Patescibacteria group bacterium]MBU1895563.1 ribonuclease H-like domain-containing protein [Patescibacteria group bacterium]
MSEIVFDIETIGDIRNYDNLKITVVSIYGYESDSYKSFEESELGDLWPILEQADRLIGYNSDHFDIPILNRYYPGDLLSFPSLDMLKVIKDSCGKRYKLNDVAKATLQIEKSADGLQAIKWFEEGKIDEIKKYCEQDVKVTKELYDFGKKNKMIYYPTLTGDIIPIAVNFDPVPVSIESDAGGGTNINLTLPF